MNLFPFTRTQPSPDEQDSARIIVAAKPISKFLNFFSIGLIMQS